MFLGSVMCDALSDLLTANIISEISVIDDTRVRDSYDRENLENTVEPPFLLRLSSTDLGLTLIETFNAIDRESSDKSLLNRSSPRPSEQRDEPKVFAIDSSAEESTNVKLISKLQRVLDDNENFTFTALPAEELSEIYDYFAGENESKANLERTIDEYKRVAYFETVVARFYSFVVS